MSTIVCQKNLESQFIETTTTLKLKVAPPPKNLDFGNWGFLQTTPNYKESSSILEKDSFYTHPLSKKSSFSKLSAKSLELCTENLGSESGSDIITFNDSNNIFTSNPSKETTKAPQNRRNYEITKVKNNFPPPLTTMSGSNSLQVLRHREGGRLIIEATPFRNSYLQAERSDGRLRLCFLTGDDDEEDDEGEDESEDELDESEEIEGEMGVEMGIENFQRISRCYGNEGLCTSNSNWKPAFWVATS